MSPLWPLIQVCRLAQNMRVQGGDPAELEDFAAFLLSVGKGTIPTFTDAQGHENFIELPERHCLPTAETEAQRVAIAFDACFPNFAHRYQDAEWLTSRAILAPLNETVDKLNEYAISLLPGDCTDYYSADSVEQSDGNLDNNRYPVELLNSLHPAGAPPHKLSLKVGMPIILLRNLSPKDGLCNGTRMICREVRSRVLMAEIITSLHKGEMHFIPRITVIPTESGLPAKLRRRQFPVKPAFAMTINKSQGQTLDFVVLYLHVPVFAHGQLYVGMSRVGAPDRLKILAQKDWRAGKTGYVTQNIVFQEVLLTTTG
jgi:hypothetical protein